MEKLKEFIKEELPLKKSIEAVSFQNPDLAERMTTTLNLLLSGIKTSKKPESAWEFSTLNSNGYPVEFTFSSLEKNIRYTVEVSGSEVLPKDRLSRLEDLLHLLEKKYSFTETIDHFRQIQGDNPLIWGAWLGVRHRQHEDHYKIYAEIPKNSSTVINKMLAPTIDNLPLLPNNLARPVAIGHELGSTWTEYYFIIDQYGLSFAQIQSLLWRTNLYDRSEDLLQLIQETRGYLNPMNAPGFMPAKYGFSLAISSTGNPPIFSFFGFARRLVATDADLRRNLLAVAERKNWDFSAYARLSLPLVNNKDKCVYHNVLAYIVPPKGSLGVHISLSPPSSVE